VPFAGISDKKLMTIPLFLLVVSQIMCYELVLWMLVRMNCNVFLLFL